MKPNYQAWGIDINSFPKWGTLAEQIRWILQFAVLAPSSHNTQPWRFQIQNNTVEVLVERSRLLGQSDPQMIKENEKFISKTPLVGVIAVSDDTPKTWIRVGEHFERMWLQATKLGIAIHPWNAPVEIGE